MNGARADPWVRTIRSPRRRQRRMMGASHHFFRTFRKFQNSAQKSIFSLMELLRLIFASFSSRSIELELLPPILLLPETRLVLLVQKEGTQDQVVHVSPHEAAIGVVG